MQERSEGEKREGREKGTGGEREREQREERRSQEERKERESPLCANLTWVLNDSLLAVLCEQWGQRNGLLPV